MSLPKGRVPLPSNKGELIKSNLCPTMDLIAFAGGGASPHVVVYRSIEWEKLFSITVPNSSGTLCWRPDGKELAVGTHASRVVLVKTETGHERQSMVALNEEQETMVDEDGEEVDGAERISNNDATITAMCWTADRVTGKAYSKGSGIGDSDQDNGIIDDEDTEEEEEEEQNEFRTFLRTRKATNIGNDHTEAPSSFGETTDQNADVLNGDAEFANVSNPNQCDSSLLGGKTLDVLVTGDNRANVTFYAFGDFKIAEVDLRRCFQQADEDFGDNYEVVKVFLTDDLNYLATCLRRHDSQEKTGETCRDQYVVSLISTQLLHDCKKQIAFIADEFTTVSSELGKLQQALIQCSRVWEEGILAPLRKLFLPLLENELGMDHGSLRQSPRQSLDDLLFDLLTKGVNKSVLVASFNNQRMSESNLQRLARSFEKSCDSITSSLERFCVQIVESILFRLSRVCGKSMVDDAYGKIGIDPVKFRRLIHMGERVLLMIRKCSLICREAKKDYLAMERWLSGTRKRFLDSMPAEEAKNTSEYALNSAEFAFEDYQRIEKIILGGDLEHSDIGIHLGVTEPGLVKKNSSAGGAGPDVPSWDRNFVAASEDDALKEMENEKRRSGLAGLLTDLEASWKSCLPDMKKCLSASLEASRSRNPVESMSTMDEVEYKGRFDASISLGGSNGSCDVAFVSSEKPEVITIWTLNRNTMKWQGKCKSETHPEDDVWITRVEHCTAAPGSKCDLEDSYLACVGGSNQGEVDRLIFLAYDPLKRETYVVRNHKLTTERKVLNFACSGPRGICCVINEHKRFELIDFLHSNDEEDGMEEEENEDAQL